MIVNNNVYPQSWLTHLAVTAFLTYSNIIQTHTWNSNVQDCKRKLSRLWLTAQEKKISQQKLGWWWLKGYWQANVGWSVEITEKKLWSKETTRRWRRSVDSTMPCPRSNPTLTGRRVSLTWLTITLRATGGRFTTQLPYHVRQAQHMDDEHLWIYYCWWSTSFVKYNESF